MAAPTTLRLVDPIPEPERLGPSVVDLGDEADPTVTFDANGVMKIENPDGSVLVDFNPDRARTAADEGDFYRNVANEIDDGTLSKIASDLLTGIEFDEQSRKEWLDMRTRGITLLGLKLEEPRGETGTSSAPLEGMATIRHPLLLEATIRFQANARGELLPAAGPVKVRNDAVPRPENQQPPYPQPPPMGHNGGPPLPPDAITGDALDELGDALEKDMNHYLTVTATEYVPDTDRMLFYIGFGGDGFKKVYNCPLRRRPVSESVDAENIVVSNAATDIKNCGRVTHKIKMRPAILRRMQIVGAYRDVTLVPPAPSTPVDPVEQKKAEIAGVRPRPVRNEDADYDIYECYCEIDLDKFAPEQFRGKALPLPYVVTLEKESRQVLAVRRNWDEVDEQCLTKQFFVQFPFIRALGFYGIGLIHILGNATLTLTAIWREFIDAGMFANFPGFLLAEGAGRQKTNQIRVPPGGSQTIAVPPGMRIQDAVMPIPYKEPGPAFTAFVQHVEEVGQRLGQTANIQIGEGKQDAPVGTTLAMIEQATKIMDSVHKRLHAAQAEEFGLLKERFQEDPEAFWRHNKKPAKPWTAEQFKQALAQRELVPVADPNNPTSMHRIQKMVALLSLVSTYGQMFNIPTVLKRILRVAGIDAEGLFNAQPAPPPPDPRMEAIKAKAQAQQQIAQVQQMQTILKNKQMELDASNKAEDRKSRETLEQMQIELEKIRLQQDMVVHAHEIKRDDAQAEAEIKADQMKAANEIALEQLRQQQDMELERVKAAHKLQMEQVKHATQLQFERAKLASQSEVDRAANEQKLSADSHAEQMKADLEHTKHQQKLQQDREKHAATLQQMKETHAAELKQAQAMARSDAQAASTPEHKQKLKQDQEAHDAKLQQNQEKHDQSIKLKAAQARAMASARKRNKSGGK